MKRLIPILCCIFAFSGCKTTPSQDNLRFFQPKSNQVVTVRMVDGFYTAYVHNERNSIEVKLQNENFRSGVTDFFIGIKNISDDSMIISRYNNFRLKFTTINNQTNFNVNNYTRMYNFNEWIKYGNRSQYERNHMYANHYKDYYKENDIGPYGDSSKGIISFPYKNFQTLSLIIDIYTINLIFRKPGEYTKETVIIDFI